MAQHGLLRALLSIARFGLAHAFFGHLYESIVDIPERFSRQPTHGEPDPRLPRLRAKGSPARYFLLTAPVTPVALLAATTTGWRQPARTWLAAATAGALCDDVLTAYIIRTLNLRLFIAGQPVAAEERRVMLRRWHRLNLVRLAVSGGAWVAAGAARRQVERKLDGPGWQGRNGADDTGHRGEPA